jgi:hypothetical protein
MSLTDPLGGSPRKLTPALGFPPRIGVVEPYVFPAAASAYSFVVPYTGEWKFVGWGAGGAGTAGSGPGASGGYFEISRSLRRGTVVTITAGLNTADTSVVLPGATATATRGNNATAGAATGGDVNLAGTAGPGVGNPGTAGLGTGGGAGGGAGGGSGAPANLPYRGGEGGPSAAVGGVGAGAGEPGIGSIGASGGLVLAVLMSA